MAFALGSQGSGNTDGIDHTAQTNSLDDGAQKQARERRMGIAMQGRGTPINSMWR
jgi:hypothetical protein